MKNREFTDREMELMENAISEVMTRKGNSNLPEVREEAKELSQIHFDIVRARQEYSGGNKK